MSKETFKDFVRKNPSLVKHVNDKNITWQKFYEMYDMYGEDNSVWGEYLTVQTVPETSPVAKADFMNYFKNINLDSVQESITSLQRVLGVIGDLTLKKDGVSTIIEDKPIYKHMDD